MMHRPAPHDPAPSSGPPDPARAAPFPIPSDAATDTLDLFRLLVESVVDYAIFVLDPQGRVLTWNPGARRLKGYEAHEIIGRHFSIFYPPEANATGFPDHELRVAAEVGRFEDEGWRLRKDGRSFWALVVITALRDEQGTLVGFAKVTRDLTERREAELRRLADARRLAEIQAAHRARSGFLAAMSHELLTPLNAIGGYADLMTMGIGGGLGAQHLEFLRRIQRSQQHLLGIINDLLNYSRIEAGQVAYDLRPVAVAPLLEEAARMVAPRLRQKGIELVLGPCAPGAVVTADRSKAEQIVLNLLTNAVKFTPGGGTIELSCTATDEGVSLRVRDTGPGIPPDMHGSIFDPFVQLGRSLSSGMEGAGLGLAISRDLARAMGGDVTVASAPGEGATFTLHLPAG